MKEYNYKKVAITFDLNNNNQNELLAYIIELAELEETSLSQMLRKMIKTHKKDRLALFSSNT